MRRRILLFGLASVVLLICVVIVSGVIFASYTRQANAKFSQVEQYLADHQAQLGNAVDGVLSDHPGESRLDVQSLPVALQAPGVRAAFLGDGHVTLVVTSNPDTDRGFRVWKGLQASEYDDTATSIPGVYQFTYCDDYPDSPKNRPN